MRVTSRCSASVKKSFQKVQKRLNLQIHLHIKTIQKSEDKLTQFTHLQIKRQLPLQFMTCIGRLLLVQLRSRVLQNDHETQGWKIMLEIKPKSYRNRWLTSLHSIKMRERTCEYRVTHQKKGARKGS